MNLFPKFGSSQGRLLVVAGGTELAPRKIEGLLALGRASGPEQEVRLEWLGEGLDVARAASEGSESSKPKQHRGCKPMSESSREAAKKSLSSRPGVA
jgi:hypothetical protein